MVDTLRRLNSVAIYDVIGDDPVLDQFESQYRFAYSGSYSDDYITGTLVSKITGVDGKVALTQGQRGRVFSKLNPRDVAQPKTTSKAFNLEQWYERAGMSTVIQSIDYGERYYDSMMPSVADCFAADNSSIYLNDSQAYGAGNKSVDNIGYINFDNSIGIPLDAAVLPTNNNNNWTRSYPFEPRYLLASRQDNVAKSFVAKKLVSAAGDPSATIVDIPPVIVSDFIPVEAVTKRIITGGSPFDFPAYVLASDANLSSKNSFGFYVTGSASVDDTSRVLFGFGDNNTMKKIGFASASLDFTPGSVIVGTNHYVEFRDQEDDVGFPGYIYSFSPIIRGWKYGVYNGLPAFNVCYYRRGKYGQLRDTLEQRPFTKFFQQQDPNVPGSTLTISSAVVEVKFVNSSGSIVSPGATDSQNLSMECTSSFPYLDGVTRNR